MTRFLVLMAEEGHFEKWEAAGPSLRERVVADFRAFDEAVRQRGTIVAGEALDHPEAARTVRPGLPRVCTEGPFAETVEQLGGFYLIDVPSQDDAVRLAGLLPREYTLEVRQTQGVQVGVRETSGAAAKFVILLGSERHHERWEAASPEDRERSLADFRAFAAAVNERGAILAGDALLPPGTTRTVRPGLPRVVTEGPFAETVEQLGGFYLIEAADVDEAVRLAGLLPREYTAEVRPAIEVTTAP